MMVTELLELGNSGLIHFSCRGSEGKPHEVFDSRIQIVLSIPGVVVGTRSACGARAKKQLNWRLDSASAMVLCRPGR